MEDPHMKKQRKKRLIALAMSAMMILSLTQNVAYNPYANDTNFGQVVEDVASTTDALSEEATATVESTEMEPVMEMGSVGAIVNVMLGGYGTSYIPRFMVEKYLDNGELMELKTEDIDIDIYSYYICNKYRWINPVMQAFIRVVKEFRCDEK